MVALISALLAANLDEDLSQLRESGDLDVIAAQARGGY